MTVGMKTKTGTCLPLPALVVAAPQAAVLAAAPCPRRSGKSEEGCVEAVEAHWSKQQQEQAEGEGVSSLLFPLFPLVVEDSMRSSSVLVRTNRMS